MTVVSVVTPAGVVPGHLATPEGDGPWPAVLVIHEAFGLNDDIRAITDRFAAEGYLAFAPDLLATGNRVACLVRVARSMSTGEGAAAEQILGLREWLAGQPDCTGRVGIAGFCLGGGFAIVMASQGFDAAAAQYARLPKNLEAAMAGSCPVVASYGGRDRSLSGAATQLEAALSAAQVEHDVKEYPEAGHSFMNRADVPLWMRPMSAAGGLNAGYVDTAAEDAWDRILRMFATALA